jgi:hypothetical protein
VVSLPFLLVGFSLPILIISRGSATKSPVLGSPFKNKGEGHHWIEEQPPFAFG